jgi:hypothetical protein
MSVKQWLINHVTSLDYSGIELLMLKVYVLVCLWNHLFGATTRSKHILEVLKCPGDSSRLTKHVYG